MISCGQALVDLLAQHEVETIFGIPGVHTLELYRGLAASGLRHVTPRHEQGAGFMADGWGRVSGRPGVCFASSAPDFQMSSIRLGPSAPSILAPWQLAQSEA